MERTARHGSGLAIVRPETAKPFGPDEVLLLSCLTPLLLNAFQAQRIAEQMQAVLRCWDDLDYASRRITLDGDTIDASDAGKAAQQEATVVRSLHGRLHASDVQTDAKLQHTLRQMRKSFIANVTAYSETVPLRNSNTRHMATLPLSHCGRGANGEAQILATLHDPSKPMRSRQVSLKKTFGLNTLKKLASLTTLREEVNWRNVEKQLGIKYNTARSYLKTVYEELGVSSKVELVGLVRSLHG